MPKRSGRPYVAGLTGSIGMGKTETAKLFARLRIPVFDSDAAVHALYDKDGAAVAPIAEAFPGVVIDGRVDRPRLMQQVKDNETAFNRLEAIVHPLVLQARHAFLEAAAERGELFAILDIPLLFETGGHKHVDAVIVVSAPPDVQRERVLRRPEMTLEKLEVIHTRQMPDAEKRAKADFVIETDQGLEHAFEQVKKVAAELRRRARNKSH